MSKTVALLDGDVYAYQAARLSEVETDWGDGLWTVHSWFDEAYRMATEQMAKVKKEVGADEVVFVWSCPSRRYWRHDVHSEYKGGRAELTARAPLALMPLKKQLAEDYENYMKPTLEGDDVLGILSTADWYRPGDKKIVVSIDKDMKTLPVTLFNPDKDYQPWDQNEGDAFAYFLAQALGGDTTDGYSGCRGISVETAEAFFKDPYRWEQYTHVFKSGPRKGMTEMKWRKSAPIFGNWEAVLSLYEKSGSESPEEDAFRNALCARILHADEYDWDNEVVLIDKIKEKLICL